jgi:hypothetical protein
LANGIEGITLNSRHNGALEHFTSAQKAVGELLDRLNKCSRRGMNEPVSRSLALSLMSDIVAAMTPVSQSITKLDGACSEMAATLSLYL